MGEVRHFAMIVLAGMDNTLKISPARGESIFAGFGPVQREPPVQKNCVRATNR